MPDAVFRHPTKQPAEVYPLEIEWANRLDSGETISTVGAAALRTDDGSDQTAAFLTLPGSIIGTRTRVTLKNGLDGKLYKVTVTITTSLGKTLEADVLVPVRNW